MRDLARGLVVMVVLASSGLGCKPEVKPDPTGLPAKIDTECQRLQRQELGQAESAFACRGLFLEAGGALIGGVKGASEGNFELFTITDQGKVGTSFDTTHSGPRLNLVSTPSGVVAVSASGAGLKVSTHNTTLSGESTLTDLSVEVGSVLAFSAVVYTGRSVSDEDSPEGVLVAAATGHGVKVWLIGSDGGVLVERLVLEHPEMSHCRRLNWSGGAGVSEITLSCEGVVPLRPAMVEGRAVVRGFNYDASEPPSTDLRVVLDVKVRPVGVTASAGAKAGAPRRYGIKQYLREQLPRPAEQRVHVLDGVALDGERYVALSCQGPDEGPVVIDVSLVQCRAEEVQSDPTKP